MLKRFVQSLESDNAAVCVFTHFGGMQCTYFPDSTMQY